MAYDTPAWLLRPAQPGDAARLAEIVVEATKDQSRWPAMTPEQEQEWLTGFADWSRESADGTDALQVIVIDDVVAGRLRLERDRAWVQGEPRSRIRLCGLQLLPAIQGRGIGTSIIRNLQSEAAEADTELDLGVELDNPRARELYERLGFTAIGQDDTELVMRWTPGPGPGTAYDGQIAADHPMGHLP